MAQPSTMPVDIEGTPGQATGPDVLIEDEALSVPSPDGYVSLVDGGSQEFAVAMPHGLEALDRVVGEPDDFMDDGVGHRGEDPLDVAVVFRAQLPLDEPIEACPLVRIEVLLVLHPPTIARGADETLMVD